MERKKLKLSVAFAVYNESSNIASCLTSVRDIADEIVVVDGGSTDDTVKIAKSFKAKVIQTDNPPIFHINKQKALEVCSGEWILQLDADEVIPIDLHDEIVHLIHNKPKCNGYFIPRKNYFWGHFMKKGGQYPDYVIRLVKKGYARFPCKSVHEQIEVNGQTGHTTHAMLHYSYKTRAEYWKKADAYTTLTSKELKASNRNRLILFVEYCIMKPVQTFFMIFFRHKGFIDGLTGFEFALYSGFHYPIAFFKFQRLT